MAEEPVPYAKLKGSRYCIRSLQKMEVRPQYVKGAAIKKWHLLIHFNQIESCKRVSCYGRYTTLGRVTAFFFCETRKEL